MTIDVWETKLNIKIHSNPSDKDYKLLFLSRILFYSKRQDIYYYKVGIIIFPY